MLSIINRAYFRLLIEGGYLCLGWMPSIELNELAAKTNDSKQISCCDKRVYQPIYKMSHITECETHLLLSAIGLPQKRHEYHHSQ